MSVAASPTGTALRLKQRYQDKIVPALIQRFAYTNAMQVPRLAKVVANIGIGESIFERVVFILAAEIAQGDAVDLSRGFAAQRASDLVLDAAVSIGREAEICGRHNRK